MFHYLAFLFPANFYQVKGKRLRPSGQPIAAATQLSKLLWFLANPLPYTVRVSAATASRGGQGGAWPRAWFHKYICHLNFLAKNEVEFPSYYRDCPADAYIWIQVVQVCGVVPCVARRIW